MLNAPATTDQKNCTNNIATNNRQSTYMELRWLYTYLPLLQAMSVSSYLCDR